MGSSTPTTGSPKETTSTSYQNLFVSALPSCVNDADLNALFAPYGTIKSAKVMLDTVTGKSRCFGFVLFEKEQEGCLAYATLNGKEQKIKGEAFTVHVAASQHDGRAAAVESSVIYVRNVPIGIAEDQVSAYFGKFGTVTGFAMKADTTSTNHRLATVEFKTVASAREAIEKTHNKKVFDQNADRPVLAKFADSNEVKAKRREKREEQWKQTAQTRIPGPIPAPPMPMMGGSLDPMAASFPSLGTTPNAPPAPPIASNATEAMFPGYRPLPLDYRPGHNRIYYQGILGLTNEGRLYCVAPEQCYYLPPAPSMPGGAPVFAQSAPVGWPMMGATPPTGSMPIPIPTGVMGTSVGNSAGNSATLGSSARAGHLGSSPTVRVGGQTPNRPQHVGSQNGSDVQTLLGEPQELTT